MKIGNAVGRAIKVDMTTITAIRGRFAKVFVEIDLLKFLVLNIVVLAKTRMVEYEGLHHICFRCGQYSHQAEQCCKMMP